MSVYKLPDRHVRLDAIIAIDDLMKNEDLSFDNTSFGVTFEGGAVYSVFVGMTGEDLDEINKASIGKSSEEQRTISRRVQQARTERVYLDLLKAWKEANQ